MKNYSGKLKIWEISALIALSVCLCAASWAEARLSAISGSLVRLHVLACSDAPEEQEIKLQVRDRVLEYLEPRLSRAGSPAEAKEILSSELQGIALAAGRAAEGRRVSVSLGRESYPSRSYEGFTLPAGEYDSLKVVLGEGRGRNWWCIVFPPLCLDAAQAERVQSVMSSDDFDVISGQEGYKLSFRLVELWGELLNALGEN